MSLLEELLRKAEKRTEKVDIPPQLQRIVAVRNKRRYFLPVIIFLSFFLGIALIFMVNQGGLVKGLKEAREKSKIEVKKERLEAVSSKAEPAEEVPSGQIAQFSDRHNKSQKSELPDALSVKPDNSSGSQRDTAETIKPVKKRARIEKREVINQKLEIKDSPSSAIEPESSDSNSGLKRELLYRANTLEARGEYERAIEYYERILNIEPSNVRVLNQIIHLYIKLGLPEKAIKYAQRLKELRPDYIPGKINYSVALIMKEEYKEAEKMLRDVLSIEPYNKTALYNLAIILEKAERYEEALEFYRRLSLTGDIKGSEGVRRLELKKSLIEKSKYQDNKD